MIDNGYAMVDGGTGECGLLAGLEAHVLQQDRVSEIAFCDRIGVMNTHPPAKKM
jgi:hypothetical protein